MTNLTLTSKTVWNVIKGGRARWSIENEVFNTLKNHGYNFEHNYGHGKKYLSTNFAMLMMLAFFFDQVQEMSSANYRKLLSLVKRKSRIAEKMRVYYQSFILNSWTGLLLLLIHFEEGHAVIEFNTS